ncbi:MAG TPA: hypothetical protein VGB18_01240, partial [Candidatus Thermoplasmatota archaeon]
MQRSLILLSALALIVPVVPTATADWQSWVYDGNAEPNTAADADHASSFMWEDGSPTEDRIIFDAIIDHNFLAFPIITQPNADGSRIKPYGTVFFHAYLGYWRDCNDDGFVGTALLGADHYIADLDDAAAVSTNCGGTPHFDGLYAQELLSIGPSANKEFDGEGYSTLCPSAADPNAVFCLGGHVNFVRDDFAKMWHDFGLPDSVPGQSRLLLPFPQGTLSDTNGHLQYVDSLTFGSLSGTSNPCALSSGGTQLCWLWPSKQTRTDPDGPEGPARGSADPNQCDEGNAVNNAVVGLSNAPAANPACPHGSSPIPNVANPVTA